MEIRNMSKQNRKKRPVPVLALPLRARCKKRALSLQFCETVSQQARV